MKTNMGKWDRIIRVIIAIVLAYFGYTGSAWWYLPAALLLITAVMGYCAVYSMMKCGTGKSAAKPPKAKKKR